MHRRSLIAAGLGSAFLATPHVARAAARPIKIGHNNTTTSIMHVAAMAMGDALRTASGGRLTLDVHSDAVLGSEAQMVSAVGAGSLDMTLGPIGSVSALAREIALTEMPYLFRDAAHARAKLDGDLGKHYAELLAPKDVRVLAFSEIGIRHITANRPVATPAALRGLKIRVPLSPAILEGFRAMGAAPGVLPFPQLPEALRTGQFDAQENPISMIVSSGLQRFQSHVTLTRHSYTSGIFLVSNDTWDELDAEGRAMLRAAAQKGAVASREFNDRVEAEGVAALRAAGMTVVTEVDRAGFQRSLEEGQAALSAVFGADAIARIRALAV